MAQRFDDEEDDDDDDGRDGGEGRECNHKTLCQILLRVHNIMWIC